MEITKDSKFKNFDGKEQVQMTLDLHNSHSIMSLLRNNIYSDPVKSFVREVYSNAVDAHARCNNKKDSIEINIYTDDLKNYFSVRDYGDSMDKDKIKSVYAVLGKSDKTEGNNEIGGWGIGAASPLAYTDHFYIDTWTKEEGKTIHREWVQYIDSSRIGCIALQKEEESEQPTGTLIRIPFEPNDRQRIVSAINLYLHFTKVKYKVKGFTFSRLDDYYDFIGSDWAFKRGNNYYRSPNHTLLVGDIPYTINSNTIAEYLDNNDLSHINNSDYQYSELFSTFLYNSFRQDTLLSVDIGKVDLSASREEVQYTDKSCIGIITLYYKMFREFMTLIYYDLVKSPNFGTACFLYSNFYDGAFTTSDGLLRKIKWEKEQRPFGTRQYLTSTNKTYQSYKLTTRYSRGANTPDKTVLKSQDIIAIETNRNNFFLIDDQEGKQLSKYVKFYLGKLDKPDSWNVIRLENLEDRTSLFDWIQEDYEFITLSSLQEFYKENYVKVKGPRRQTSDRSICKTFGYEGKVVREKADGLGKLFNEATAERVPESIQYYLVEEEYQSIQNEGGLKFSDYDYTEVAAKLTAYLSHKEIDPANLYYSRKAYNYYKNDNWVNLLDIIKEDYKKAIYKEANFFKEFYTVYLVNSDYKWILNDAYDNLVEPNGRFSYLRNVYKESLTSLKKQKFRILVLTMLKEDYRLVISRSTISYYEMPIEHLDDYKVSDECKSACIKVHNLYKTLLEKYPLLNIDRINRQFEVPDIAKYINLMEKDLGDYIDLPIESSKSSYAKLIDYVMS